MQSCIFQRLAYYFCTSVVCSYAAGYIPDPKWMPETMDATESYGNYIFSYIYEYIYMIKFNL